MLIVRGGNWPEHRPWFCGVLAVSIAATLWCSFEATRAGRWPGGGSLPGLVLGMAGGLIIAFEMLLWPRRKFRVARLGRAKLWMKAHIWLGLLSVPLLALHGGFRWWGGALSSVLMIEFLAVIATGIWGLVLQQIVPKMMLDNVPAETIRSQIAPILGQYLDEAGRIVRMTCGVNEPSTPSISESRKPARVLVIGAVRTPGVPTGKAARSRLQIARVPGSGALLDFFEETVSPYLVASSGRGMPLASPRQAEAIFRNVRSWLAPEAHEAVARLEELCHRRRQFDLQARLHFWLHGWICIHLPLSVSLFVLMLAHIYLSLRFL